MHERSRESCYLERHPLNSLYNAQTKLHSNVTFKIKLHELLPTACKVSVSLKNLLWHLSAAEYVQLKDENQKTDA